MTALRPGLWFYLAAKLQQRDFHFRPDVTYQLQITSVYIFSGLDLGKRGETDMKKQRRKQKRFQSWKSAYVMRLRKASTPKGGAHRPHQRRSGVTNETLIAPSHFIVLSAKSFQSGSDVNEYFAFLTALRAVQSRNLVIDMRGVRRMIVDAALLFKAELSRLVQLRRIRIDAIAPTSHRMQQVLRQTGIDKLLNLEIDIELQREDVIHWRIAEGARTGVDPIELEPMMADIEEVTGLATHPVYQGIIESIGNCTEHAYKDHPDVTWKMPESPSWWVFQQVRDGVLTVVVCDLGIGVNRALPLTLANEQGLMKKLMHIVRRTKGEDSRALLAAMEYGRSSTGLHERGRGMKNAHAVINDHGEGDFYAISNKGFYVYRKDTPSAAGQSRTVKLRHSIHGTILGWRLPLERISPQGM